MNTEMSIIDLLEKAKKIIMQADLLIDEKKIELLNIQREKELFKQQQAELKKIEEDLNRREDELNQQTKLNRERANLLDLKEKRMIEERDRLKNTLINLNLEET